MRCVLLLSLMLLVSLPPGFLSAQVQFGTQGTTETCTPFLPPSGNEFFEGIEYRAGAGFPDKFKGTLYLTADSLVLGQDCVSDATLRLPMAAVTDVEFRESTRDPSTSDRLLMGAFAREKHEAFLRIAIQMPRTVDVIVLRVPADMGPGLAQKIRFYAKLPTK